MNQTHESMGRVGIRNCDGNANEKRPSTPCRKNRSMKEQRGRDSYADSFHRGANVGNGMHISSHRS